MKVLKQGGRLLADPQFRFKAYVVLAALLINVLINWYFFNGRADYMRRYEQARQELETMQTEYEARTAILEGLQDSLQHQLTATSSLLAERRRMIDSLRQQLTMSASTWESLGDKQRAKWIENALNTVEDED